REHGLSDTIGQASAVFVGGYRPDVKPERIVIRNGLRADGGYFLGLHSTRRWELPRCPFRRLSRRTSAMLFAESYVSSVWSPSTRKVGFQMVAAPGSGSRGSYVRTAQREKVATPRADVGSDCRLESSNSRSLAK